MGRTEGLARVSTLIERLGYLARNNYRLLTSPDYHLRHTGVHSEQVDTILRYLHHSFHNPIRTREIAHTQGMTPSTFSRFFKQVTGDTFTTFVRRLRIDHACRLLHDPKNSVADICFMTDYNNISNFNRHFRHLIGMTPGEYRRTLDTSYLGWHRMLDANGDALSPHRVLSAAFGQPYPHSTVT